MRNWMPLASMHLPITPPRASISRTICPLATPPMAGLQLIWATVSAFIVSRQVLSPSRAAASAASTPAWPAPTTTTSNRYVSSTDFPRTSHTPPGHHPRSPQREIKPRRVRVWPKSHSFFSPGRIPNADKALTPVCRIGKRPRSAGISVTSVNPHGGCSSSRPWPYAASVPPLPVSRDSSPYTPRRTPFVSNHLLRTLWTGIIPTSMSVVPESPAAEFSRTLRTPGHDSSPPPSSCYDTVTPFRVRCGYDRA